VSDFIIPAGFAIGSLIVLSAVLVADLLLVVRRPHVPSAKESALWVTFYVALALGFAGLMTVVVSPVVSWWLHSSGRHPHRKFQPDFLHFRHLSAHHRRAAGAVRPR
jgi:D-alanyl-lipoteichoic acid acyltransferase DltB (MBOAT superfamily)